MTHVMAKGANIALPVAAVRAVLRWSATPGAPDVDASALLLGTGGKVRSDADFVFYNQPRHPSGLVRHLPKQQTSGGGEITDTVEAELGKLPAEVDRVVLAGSSEGGTFRSVSGLRLLLFDAAAGDGAPALAEFAMADGDEVTALVAGELYRRAGAWKFRAVGQGYASGLIGLATDFGITVEDEGDTRAGAAAGPPAGDPRAAVPDPRPAGRPEPGTFTLAPAVPQPPVPQAPATTPAAAQAGGAQAPAGVPAGTPPPPPKPPTVPPNLPPAPTAPPAGRPGYGYPPPNTAPQSPQQGGYGYPPPAPRPGYGYPQQQPPAPAPGYGYPQQQQPQQQPGYGYPPPNTAPQSPQQGHQGRQAAQPPVPQQPAPPAEEFALPPQGPQFQPR
ncbi:TerD family protein [Kitasatospora sp. NPDC089913]|uniref:TerD family protein n=1 Tax=Kitasatospora sp. NPDC089913 TaxID=3364080 RepID=UPI0037F4C003